MQEQIEARAALNGGGAGHGPVPMLDAETMPVPAAPVRVGMRTSPVWAAADDPVRGAELRRRIMETDEPLKRIAADYGTTVRTLRRVMDDHGWWRIGARRAAGKPTAAPGRRLAADIADAGMVRVRLLRAVDRQIDQVDRRLRKKGAEGDEKDSRILGNLAKTLGVVMQMGAGGKTSNHAEPQDSDELEADLARRITRWARGE